MVRFQEEATVIEDEKDVDSEPRDIESSVFTSDTGKSCLMLDERCLEQVPSEVKFFQYKT